MASSPPVKTLVVGDTAVELSSNVNNMRPYNNLHRYIITNKGTTDPAQRLLERIKQFLTLSFFNRIPMSYRLQCYEAQNLVRFLPSVKGPCRHYCDKPVDFLERDQH